MGTNKKEQVNFFTNEINVSFVQNEITNLASYFSKVNVFAFKNDNSIVFPSNVTVKEVNYEGYSTAKTFLGNFFVLISILSIELFKTPKYLFNFSIFIKVVSDLLRCIYLYKQFSNSAELKNSNSVNYTFWFNQWATVLSLLVKGNKINTYYSRTHGTDLYEERVPKTHSIPFRWVQLKYVRGVFSVSKKGAEYLIERYPSYIDKIHCSYLGTNDLGLAEFNLENKFTIVSCANVRNIKRIHLIPNILEKLEFDVKWVHIGNENLNSKDASIPLYKTNKLKLKGKKNIETEFKGTVSNSEVLDFYKKNSVNLYISVSETEGLPVSMMEVISFGIPILATDVGGCNEIVTPQTGLLVPKDFDSIFVAKQILQFKNSEMNTIKYRIEARDFWKEKFDGAKNFELFANQISAN